MTKPVQPRPAIHVSTPITRISGTTFPFAAEVPSAIHRFRFRSGKRKTLSLWIERELVKRIGDRLYGRKEDGHVER